MLCHSHDLNSEVRYTKPEVLPIVLYWCETWRCSLKEGQIMDQIWGFHGGENSHNGLWGYDAVLSCSWAPVFRRNINLHELSMYVVEWIRLSRDCGWMFILVNVVMKIWVTYNVWNLLMSWATVSFSMWTVLHVVGCLRSLPHPLVSQQRLWLDPLTRFCLSFCFFVCKKMTSCLSLCTMRLMLSNSDIGLILWTLPTLSDSGWTLLFSLHGHEWLFGVWRTERQ